MEDVRVVRGLQALKMLGKRKAVEKYKYFMGKGEGEVRGQQMEPNWKFCEAKGKLSVLFLSKLQSKLEHNGFMLKESILEMYVLFKFDPFHNWKLGTTKSVKERVISYLSLGEGLNKRE